MIECPECQFEYDKKEAECPNCKVSEALSNPEFVTQAAITVQFITPKGTATSSNIQLGSKTGKLWPNEDEACLNLIKAVEKKFKRKNKFHSFLDKDDNIASKPTILKKYIKKEISFKDLVEYFMKELISEADRIGAKKITGGSVLFMHYKTQDSEDDGQLLAILVDKKYGFNFEEKDDSLKPINTEHLNLDSIRQAVLIDLTLFNSTYPNIPEEETYLRFIEGNSNGVFFKYSFGCNENNINNKRSIDQLRLAILEFDEKHKPAPNFSEKARRSFDYEINKAEKSGIPVNVDILYRAIESNLPKDSKYINTFKSYVVSNGYEVNQHIAPTRNSADIGKFVQIQSEDESFKGKIIRKNIGKKGSGKSIVYDNGYLILRVTSEKQRSELERISEANEHDKD